MALRWYCLRTKPQAEYIAASGLVLRGFETFFPRIKSPWPRRGHADEPLFPGYLFVRYDGDGQGYYCLYSLPGVGGMIRFGDEVPSMPEEVIAGLARRVEEINERGGLWREFRPGEKVHVHLGQQESLAEVVEMRSSRARVLVLLEFLGRLVRAEVLWENVQPVRGSEGLAGKTKVGRPSRRTRGKGRWVRGCGPRAAELLPVVP
jgi:transcriptional antiterminator RfaH